MCAISTRSPSRTVAGSSPSAGSWSTGARRDRWEPEGNVRSMEPTAALRRIAYLLEADREASYKLRAFRHAAAALDAVGRDQLEALAATGRLTSLPGVGDTTARVVTEALSGDVPAYL